jgi:hypothetical protein
LSIYDYGDVNAIVPPGGIGVLVLGLLLFGANLYALKITDGFTRWNDLSSDQRLIAVIPIVALFLAMCLVLGLFYMGLRAVGE